MFEIKVADNVTSARLLKDRGYIPVECVFDDEDVVDKRHLSHLRVANVPAVALQHYGEGVGWKFVIRQADAQTTFAVAALAGVIPRGGENESVIPVANTIAHVTAKGEMSDALAIMSYPTGGYLLAWRDIIRANNPTLPATEAVWRVFLWRTLLAFPLDQILRVVDAG